MYNIKVLTRTDVEKLLKVHDVIDTVESVYCQKATGDAVAWPVVFYEFNPGVADMDIKSGWLKGSNIFGLKLVSFFGENAQADMPTLVGFIAVVDDRTGAPLGLLDGSYITGIRTGAAGAIGAKYLANPDAEDLFILGAGNVASFQVAATLTALPKIKRVRVCDPMSFDNAKEFCQCIREKCLAIGADVDDSVTFEAVDTEQMPEAVRQSQIIITVTPSKTPVIKSEWVSPGTHFSCIGSDMEGKEEIDPEIFRDARVFVDDTPHCVHDGETEIPIKKGIISESDIAGEIGEVILGSIKGRTSHNQITIYDACGMALLDLATAKIALERADAQGLGGSAEL